MLSYGFRVVISEEIKPIMGLENKIANTLPTKEGAEGKLMS